MPSADHRPAADADPVESDDLDELRAEILRLRDASTASVGRIEVLEDRVAELEARERELDDTCRHLQEELARNPLMRVVGAVRRRIGREI